MDAVERRQLLKGLGYIGVLCVAGAGVASLFPPEEPRPPTAAATAAPFTPRSTSTPRPPTATPVPPTPTPVPPTATPIPKMGETVLGKTWGYKVFAVEHPGKVLKWSQFGNTSQAKGEWFVVNLALANGGKENYPINFWDFELHDGAGVKYKHATDLGAFAYPESHGLTNLGGQFPPGVVVQTALVFDVAPGLKDPKLYLVQEKRYIELR